MSSAYVAPFLEPFTDEQKEIRKGGITASEIGCLMGVSRWGGPHKVWRDKKLPMAANPQDSEDAFYGKVTEHGSRQYYEHVTGHKVTVPGTIISARNPLVRATPDGLVSDELGPYKTVQIKAPRYSDEWGDAGSHDFPSHIMPQLHWEMAAAGVVRCDLVALIGRGWRIYPDIAFDEAYFTDMLKIATEFWDKYIVGNAEPPLDGTEESLAYVRNKYPRATQPDLVDNSAATHQLALEYAQADDDEKRAKARKDAAKAQLMAIIGNHSGLSAPWGKITHKEVKQAAKVDYKAVVNELKVSENIIQRHTFIPPGYRRLLVNVK